MEAGGVDVGIRWRYIKECKGRKERRGFCGGIYVSLSLSFVALLFLFFLSWGLLFRLTGCMADGGGSICRQTLVKQGV
jgi:hypothetical protein